MRSFSSALFLTVFAFSPLAMALNLEQSEPQYISWCSENVVVTSDEQGQEKTLANCSADGLLCRQEMVKVGSRSALTAACR